MVKGLLTLLVTANTKGFDSALGKTGQKLKGFRGAMAGVTKAMGAFGIALGIGSILRDAGQRIVAFDKAMVNLSAILGVSRKEMKRLEDQAIALGGSTIFTANEVGDLQTVLARFGFSAKEIEASTKAILDLAAASGTDLSTATDAAASTLRAFGLDASQMSRVADVMTNSFTQSALSVETYSEAMKYAAPLAKAAGISIEETSAMLGILADNGLRGSIAGTSLRRIFTELATTGKTMTEIFKEAGGSANFMADTLETADDAVGKYALSAFVILAKNAELIEQNTEAFSQLGSAARIAEKQLTSIANNQKILNSRWEQFILEVEKGDGALTAIYKDAIRSGIYFLDVLSNTSTGLKAIYNLAVGNGFYKDWEQGNSELEKTEEVTKQVAKYLREAETYAKGFRKGGSSPLEADFKAAEVMLTKLEGKSKKAFNLDPAINQTMEILRKTLGDVAVQLDTVTESDQKFNDQQEEWMNKALGNTKKITYQYNEDAKLWEEIVTWMSEAQVMQEKLAEEYAKQQNDKYKEELALKNLLLETEIVRNAATGEYEKQAFVIRNMKKDFELIAKSQMIGKVGGETQGDKPRTDIVLTPTTASILSPEYLAMLDAIQSQEEGLINTNFNLGESFMQLSQSIGQSLSQGADSWEEYSNNLGNVLMDIISNYIMSAATAAVAGAVKDTSSIPWGWLAIPAVTGLALGMVKTAFNSSKQMARPMADGGIAYGTTYAMVGEYATAGRDPEVVSPLSKLKTMIGDAGGATEVTGEFYLKGRTLVAAIDREQKRSKRYGG